MYGESSEQRRGSATGRFKGVAGCLALAMLIASTAACSTTWTGSVGAVLAKDNTDGRLFVRETPPGMGAARAGVAIGDEVIAIEGTPVAKMTPAEVHEALAGKVGTKVKVTIVRAGSTIEYTVERGPLTGT